MIALVAICLAGPVGDGAARWQAGDMQGAIAAWQPAVDAGWGSARVKFDLGNAWYRRGDLPRALAYWRAAGHLAPREAGVSHNLAIARSELEKVPLPAGDPALWMRVVTPGELGLIGVLLTAVGSGGLVRRRRRMDGPRLPWVGLAVWGLVLGGMATWGWWAQVRTPVAVVVDRPALAREAPEASAATRIELPPGTEVAVVGVSGAFLLVETGEGERGWVPDGSVLRVPR